MGEKKVLLTMILVFAIMTALILGSIWLNYARADDNDYYILCKPGGTVNVRKKASMEAHVVGWIEFGRVVHTDGKQKNGFTHIVDIAAEVTEGWVYSGYLVYDPPREEKFVAEVWGGDVIARSCVNGRRLRVLKEGKRVIVYAKSNAWAYTNKGYVMCDWLKEVE